MKKLAIVGAGNAACISALSHYYNNKMEKDLLDEIEIYHDPSIPIERVGQGSTLFLPRYLFRVLGINFYHPQNPIKATFKSGILYENWGKKYNKNFHPFPMDIMSIHYVPELLSKTILECGLFKVTEKNIKDPEKEIDADFIIDCRGRNNRDKNLYRKIINPLNSVILADKKGRDVDLLWSGHIATPNGWTFVIPNHDSVSYGYLYNNTITSKEDAEKDFIDRFDVIPDGYLNFENYIAKNMYQGERTILNGNRLFFFEPMESNSGSFYDSVSSLSGVLSPSHKPQANATIQRVAERIQNFIMWHYAKGSKYDTPFWDYAIQLSKGTFDKDEEFIQILEFIRSRSETQIIKKDFGNAYYDQWPGYSIENWDKV